MAALVKNLGPNSKEFVLDQLDKITDSISNDIDTYMALKSPEVSWIDYLSTPDVVLKHSSTFNHIGKPSENISELLHQVRHMHVILGFLMSNFCDSDNIVTCHATQTSGDDEGDLMTPHHTLEAYGGVDITNNQKINKTLKNLYDSGQGKKKFIEIYESSIMPMDLKNLSRFSRKYEGGIYQCEVLDAQTITIKNQVHIRIFHVEVSKA